MKKFLWALAALLFCSVQNAEACSCAGWPSACGAYKSAQAVFIGSVRSVDFTKANDGNREWIAGQTAVVQVEKVFKGSLKPEVIFKSFGTSCDAQYKEGQRWLFYTTFDTKEKAWVIGGCERSTLIEHAVADLLYLAKLPSAAETTRISGRISLYNDPSNADSASLPSLLGIKIRITGNDKTYEAFTDKNGVYEIYGLPPGVYRGTAEVPIGMTLKFSSMAGARGVIDTKLPDGRIAKELGARLDANSCVSIDFSISVDSRISGRLLGRNGRPMPRVCLDLLRADEDVKVTDRFWRIFACTDADGSYNLLDIPPGKYVIAANPRGGISSERPFPTTYYPGTTDRNKATEVIIGIGDVRKDYDIELATESERRVLSGVVLSSDGRPFEQAWVVFVPDGASTGADAEARVQVNKQGEFELPILVGLKGKLFASLFVNSDVAQCPETQKWVKANGIPFMESKPLQLEVLNDMTDISLVLPVPFCQQEKPKRP